MAIRLFDSLRRELRELQPSQPDGVFRMYCCGPTVYAPAHIGNFRTFLIQDVLRRLLELEFGADKVKHVRNLTDVDDRTISQAKREKKPLAEITKKWTDQFHDDCRALNILPMDAPHVEPKATEHIPEQVAMINELLAKGLAYVAPDGSVYYRIAAFPKYGALSRIRERELKATITAADDDHKDAIGDFALWKAHKPDEDGDVKWPGPRGAAAGRPGWHVECSAMSKKYLGDTLDLHAGGVDLLFPHHENEIAQSEGCTGHLFSHHWYHSEFLLVDGRKMSKSLGNLYTLGDLIGKGFSPMAVRYALLSGHPRKQLNFTSESLNDAEKNIRWMALTRTTLAEDIQTLDGVSPSTRFDGVFEALRDDLNLPRAMGALHEALDSTIVGGANLVAFDRIMSVLGLTLDAAQKKSAVVHVAGVGAKIEVGQATAHSIAVPKDLRPGNHVLELSEKRWAARQAKDFNTADALRAELAAAGWAMLDGKDGYRLEPLKK